MPKLKTLDDLKRVRDEAQQTMKMRLDTGTTIIVGMGTCGIAAGARDTMHAIMEELAKRKIDAHVTTVGCIGMCVREPLVDIEQAGQAARHLWQRQARHGAAAHRGAPGQEQAGGRMGGRPGAQVAAGRAIRPARRATMSLHALPS